MKEQRLSHIELLRIISMMLIIAHHLSIHGIMLYNSTDRFQLWKTGTEINKITSAFFFPGGEVGVAVFFMITGYFMINRDKGNVLKIVLETSFYGLVSLLLFLVAKTMGAEFVHMRTASAIKLSVTNILLPGSGGGYWFITTYIVLIEILPLINPFLRSINKRCYLVLIFLFWIVWYSLASFINVPYYYIQKAIFFYTIGAYFSLFKKRDKQHRLLYIFAFFVFWIIGCVISYAIAFVGSSGMEILADKLKYEALESLLTSTVVPMCSISFFQFFSSLDLGCNLLINKIASTVLGVYLLHDSIIGRNLLWFELFKVDKLFASKLFLLSYIILVLFIFTVCSLIDMARQRFIEPIVLAKANHIINSMASCR